MNTRKNHQNVKACKWAASVMAVFASGSVLGGTPLPTPDAATLPVDSPIAIGGLAIVLAVIGYRLLRKK